MIVDNGRDGTGVAGHAQAPGAVLSGDHAGDVAPGREPGGDQTEPRSKISPYQSALGVSGPRRTLSFVMGAAWMDLIFIYG